ncbi:hypothetical protein Hanom_Chr12g01168771 [Helianthus anomalus]
MMKGLIYSRRVREGGATLPAAMGRQLSDQGEYPFGLLSCGQGSGIRGAPIFVRAGDVVLLMSVCSWIRYRSTWRLMTGDTCCPFCRKEHLWCHLEVFQKVLEASGFILLM